MADRVVAIHQPNFFPWLGYFDKIARADVFVFLDHVQFQKKGGNYANRVRMFSGGEQTTWVTAPVVRSESGVRRIDEVELDPAQPWRQKIRKTIENTYRRAPRFEEVWPAIAELVENPTGSLAEYNITAVRRIAEAIGLDRTKFATSSSLEPAGEATEMLVGITKALEGTVYLAGGGAEGYQDDALFEAAGIEPRRQRFEHPRYGQLSAEPVDGLSVIDALMSLGFAGTGELLTR